MNELFAAEESLEVLPTGGELAWGIIAVVMLVVWLGIALLAGRDMSNRGQRGGLWTLIVLVAPPIGLLLWAALRTNRPRATGDSGAG